MAPTLTSTRRREPGAPRLEPQLFVALECERPLAGPSRYRLSDVDVVTIGRGETRAATQSGRTLSLLIPDGRMSSKHARLACVGGGWLVEDLGSKNGTFVDGIGVARTELDDGDVIEIGHTLLLYRRVPVAATTTIEDWQLGAPTLSSELGAALERLERIATSNVTVLVRGESGSGKELCARKLHERSGRRGPFVAVNCGALVESLVQSELFGHKRGAFSGADEDRPGLVRSAEGGTLFLDEIGDLPAAAQAVLLRVLQEKEVKAVGAVESLPVDVRVVSATHRDLERMMAESSFRADLYARLCGFELRVPPLRDRREDIGLCVAELLARHHAPAATTLACEAGRALFAHDWPLNVRELEQCLASAAALSAGAPIGLEHLPAPVRAAIDERDATETGRRGAPPQLGAEEQRLRDDLVARLAEHQGNVSAVARDLGKDRKQVHRWMRRFQIVLGDYRR